MSSIVLPTRVLDYVVNERGVVPGLAAWRRRFHYPTRVAA